MSWRTSSPVLALRSVGRVLGINRRIARWLHGPGYESAYDDRLRATIAVGDCVWDIGANVGYYTRMFSEDVGPTGHVVAFEPSKVNLERLQQSCAPLGNVVVQHMGLGSKDSEMFIRQGADSLGATSRVLPSGAAEDRVVIRSVDSVLKESTLHFPNVVKIDVEGHEWDVLQGMRQALQNPALRSVGVEVHFRTLEADGKPWAPGRIEQMLKEAGFSVAWSDSSHLLGVRRPR